MKSKRKLFTLYCQLRKYLGPRQIRAWDMLVWKNCLKGDHIQNVGTQSFQDWHTPSGFHFALDPYYFLDANIMLVGSSEPELMRFIDRNIGNEDTCFDVGSNIGTVAVPLGRRVGHRGKVYAFEPVPWLFERLQLHLKLNQLHSIVLPYNLALSDKEENVTAHCAELGESNQGMMTIFDNEHPSLKNLVAIRATTLDSFVDRHAIRNIKFIKADIQGAELKFLNGGKRTISEMRPTFILEISKYDLELAGNTPAEVQVFLSQFNYQMKNILKDGSLGPPLPQGYLDNYSSSGNFCFQPK